MKEGLLGGSQIIINAIKAETKTVHGLFVDSLCVVKNTTQYPRESDKSLEEKTLDGKYNKLTRSNCFYENI